MNKIRSGYYRVSVKALILNETRDKFLLCEEETGVWELPGGGLAWGATAQEDLSREIKEEMGLVVKRVADNPAYFVTGQNLDKTLWVANVVYETELTNLDFTPSNECVNIKFVNRKDVEEMNVFSTVKQIAEMFSPANRT